MDTSEEINEESDHDESYSIGYYTRSKRRKLHDNKDACGSSPSSIPEGTKRKNPIMFVPTEVLHNVFKYLTYHELSSRIRLVNRRFKTIADNLLNLAFRKLDEKVHELSKSVFFSIPYIHDDMEIRCVVKLLNTLDLLHIQYWVIFSTIWRYVYNPYYKSNNSSMYAGFIIDVYHKFFWKFTHAPNELYAPSIIREYGLPSEVTKIIQMTKCFCVHFDKVSEESMPNPCLYSGCKTIDILDAAKFIKRTTLLEERINDRLVAKYTYFFGNSWFIALPIPATKPMDYNQRQRMMHMRLRRLALAHNEMFAQYAHYEREIILRPMPETRIKKPGNNVYTGYGDVEDTFFYYGVMNDGAYSAKFNIPDENDEEDDEEDILDALGQQPGQQEVNNNQQNGGREAVEANSEDILYRLPHLGLRIEVEVNCPINFAPWEYLSRLRRSEQRELRHKSRVKGNTELQVTFDCFGAYYPRLPTQYVYHFKARKA